MIYDFISFLSRIIDRGIKSYRREKGRSVFEKEREKGREKEREGSLERERERMRNRMRERERNTES